MLAPADNTIDLGGEHVTLWRAVLATAFMDACRPPREEAAGMSKGVKLQIREEDREREIARRWLLSRSGDFREVCALAGLDWEAVHDQARRLAREGWRPGTRYRFDKGM